MKSRTGNIPSESESPHNMTRSRILTAAIRLLSESGRDAVTTRAVAEAAGVQPPVLYRHFKDKDAMLDALSEHGFLTYTAEKRRAAPESDPVEVLRAGWDLHVEFGLTQPALYMLMYAQPRPGAASSAGELSLSMLRQHMRQIAAAGRLCIAEEQAVSLFHSAAVGVVLTLLSSPPDARNMTLSHLARNAVLVAIANPPVLPIASPEKTAALTLRAALNEHSQFSTGELSLLKEWLDRLIT